AGLHAFALPLHRPDRLLRRRHPAESDRSHPTRRPGQGGRLHAGNRGGPRCRRVLRRQGRNLPTPGGTEHDRSGPQDQRRGILSNARGHRRGRKSSSPPDQVGSQVREIIGPGPRPRSLVDLDRSSTITERAGTRCAGVPSRSGTETTREDVALSLHRRIGSRQRFLDYLRAYRSRIKSKTPERQRGREPGWEPCVELLADAGKSAPGEPLAAGTHRSLPVLYRELYRALKGHRRTIALALLGLSVATLLKLVPPASTKV